MRFYMPIFVEFYVLEISYYMGHINTLARHGPAQGSAGARPAEGVDGSAERAVLKRSAGRRAAEHKPGGAWAGPASEPCRRALRSLEGDRRAAAV